MVPSGIAENVDSCYASLTDAVNYSYGRLVGPSPPRKNLKTSEIVTLCIAIWGAVLSSITLIWNLYKEFTKKGRLSVTCYIGNIAHVGIGVDPTNYLVWRITNTGGEPVVLTHIGGSFNNGHDFMINSRSPLPMTLKPGEYVIEHSADLSTLESKLESLWASDSLGHTFKAKQKQVRKLKKKYAIGAYSRSTTGAAQ